MVLKLRQRLILVAVCFPLLASGRDAVAQPVSGSIEGGLQDLAQTIVTKSNQNDADVIAVLPFPNSDGSCSVLSTYLADELIQSLFTVAGAKLKIIERSQLDALLREIKIGEGGLLNPTTTQKLGTLSGVKALALGTVAVVGDHIRINARLISAANGQTVSAAAVSIARNGEIDGLMQQSIGSSNGVCGSSGLGNSDSASDSGGNQSSPQAVSASNAPAATHEGVTFTVQTVSRSMDKKSISVVLALTDRLKNSIQAVMVQPKASSIDDQATLAPIDQANGIQICADFSDGSWCAANWPRTRWTTLSPNMPTMLLLRFASPQPIQGSHISLAASLLLSPVTEAGTDQKPVTPEVVSVSLANIPIPVTKVSP
jgi:TolB-like protein